MNVSTAIAEILKREGVGVIFGYPRNRVLEAAAAQDIRTIIVRQERTGVHMADALSRLTRGEQLGVFAMQHGPGAENSYGGVAQAYAESVPILVLPQGYAVRTAHLTPNFNSTTAMAAISKHAEPLTAAAEVPHVFRRAFTQLRNGRGRPVVVELPHDVSAQKYEGELHYAPVVRTRYAPDPEAVGKVADALVAAQRPVLYAGQGIHWANAYAELQALAELLAAPVCTSLAGKSGFDETHPLALGAGGNAMPKGVRHFLDHADLIFGIGCSFTETAFGVAMPKSKAIIQATLDPADINQSVAVTQALVGDAKLTLAMLIDACRQRLGGAARDRSAVVEEIRSVEEEWMRQWLPKLTSDQAPLSPYRVLWDLQQTVDVANTIITHDAGSPRDQLSPFWKTRAPLSYLGWGKSTQLGYGLGLAMGAKLACPDKLCINVWGDAAIGFTGMDFETAVRERLPILSVLLNNASMAMELTSMPIATEKYRSTDISGHYAKFAEALGGYGERVERPEEIVPAIRRAFAEIEQGRPALLEFITRQETESSRFPVASEMPRAIDRAACQGIADLRRIAKARLPKGIYEFYERGSEDDAALAGNRAGWAAVKLLPHALRDVVEVDPSAELLGTPSALPLAVAPTGAAGLMHYQGDLLLARAAAKAGVPFTISSASTMDIESIAAAGGRLWFQLYLFEDRSLSADILRRAAAAGCDTLLITADIPVPSNREYNRRNGFGIPFSINARNAVDIVSHPRWFASVMGRYFLNGGIPRQANLPAHLKTAVTMAAPVGARFKGDNLTWEEADRLRADWPGKVLIKGILRPEEAERAASLGFDGVVVSNHGGRGLDASPATAAALPAIVDTVGSRMAVLVDGGITRGSDIARALALGAQGVLAGRAPLYGLAAAGEAGVARALTMLKSEFVTSMALLGARSVAEIDAGLLA